MKQVKECFQSGRWKSNHCNPTPTASTDHSAFYIQHSTFPNMLLFFLILAASFILQLFLPWWIIALVAFALALWKGTSSRQAFWSGFGAIVFLWAATALVIHLRNEGILTAKIAGLFALPFPALMILITALVGGLVGGLAALSGFYWQRLLLPGAAQATTSRAGNSAASVAFKSRHDTVR
jgi:hypothetical protein